MLHGCIISYRVNRIQTGQTNTMCAPTLSCSGRACVVRGQRGGGRSSRAIIMLIILYAAITRVLRTPKLRAGIRQDDCLAMSDDCFYDRRPTGDFKILSSTQPLCMLGVVYDIAGVPTVIL